MSQSTSKPRFTVRRRESRRDARCWVVVDRRARKLVFRSFNRTTAEQVAAEHNQIFTPAPAGEWPAWTEDGQWVLTTPEIAPAEEQALEEPTADDREWWAQQDADATAADLIAVRADLAAYDEWVSGLEAQYHATRYEEADLAEFRR